MKILYMLAVSVATSGGVERHESIWGSLSDCQRAALYASRTVATIGTRCVKFSAPRGMYVIRKESK
jgi:hypothetical protein